MHTKFMTLRKGGGCENAVSNIKKLVTYLIPKYFMT